MDAEEIDDNFYDDPDVFNDAIPLLSEEEDYADTTANQSSDSLFRSSGSNLYVPNPRPLQRTPRKNKKRQRVADKSAKFRCPVCQRALKTGKGLQKHVLNIHKLREAAKRRPTPERLKEQCVLDSVQVCLDVKDAPTSTVISGDGAKNFAEAVIQSTFPEPTSEFREFVEVCVQPLLAPLYESKTVAPSAIRQTVRMHLHTVLSDPDVRQNRLSKLLAVIKNQDLGEEVQDVALGFLQEFCRRLGKTTAAFIIKSMRNAPDDPHVVTSSKYSKDDFDSMFSQQTLHNILGSTTKVILRRCRQYKGNEKWVNIQKVVLHRFAQLGVVEARSGEHSFWTALLARKSYTFVSEPVLKFFR